MTSILVDDGVTTGSTMRAAIAALRQQCPSKLIVAVPTAPPSTCNELRMVADEVVALITPLLFFSVGHWYITFDRTSDEEVRQLYLQSKRRRREVAARALGCKALPKTSVGKLDKKVMRAGLDNVGFIGTKNIIGLEPTTSAVLKPN